MVVLLFLRLVAPRSLLGCHVFLGNRLQHANRLRHLPLNLLERQHDLLLSPLIHHEDVLGIVPRRRRLALDQFIEGHIEFIQFLLLDGSLKLHLLLFDLFAQQVGLFLRYLDVLVIVWLLRFGLALFLSF